MSSFVHIGRLASLASHTRYLLTLRSKARPSDYHSLILFRLSPATADVPNLYAMESTCPHLGADLSHADVEFDPDPEIEEMTAAVVCPWHRYDFDLRTGESSTGLKACAYPVELRETDVWVGAPGEGPWEVVEKRPVSEDFVEANDRRLPTTTAATSDSVSDPIPALASLEILDDEPEPKTLMEWACRILNTANLEKKVALTRRAATAWRTGKITSTGQKKSNLPSPPDLPPRENLVTVEPGKVGKRGKAGSEWSRIAILHALANIEQWAIDLAWDIIARFGSAKVSGEPLPPQFFADWVKVAEDEAKHFSLLSARLTQLNTYYGSQAVHAGLWDSATKTAHSLSACLCIIHLVHEARGLDVNPGTINKSKATGDAESIKALEVIHWDEITHVTAGALVVHLGVWVVGRGSGAGILEGGARAFLWCFENQGLTDIIVQGPFNVADRARARMSLDFYEMRGEATETAQLNVGGTRKDQGASMLRLEAATTKPGQNIGADGNIEVSYR